MVVMGVVSVVSILGVLLVLVLVLVLVMTVFNVVGFPIALSTIVNTVLVCLFVLVEAAVTRRRMAEQVGQQVGTRFWSCLSVRANRISDRG